MTMIYKVRRLNQFRFHHEYLQGSSTREFYFKQELPEKDVEMMNLEYVRFVDEGTLIFHEEYPMRHFDEGIPALYKGEGDGLPLYFLE